MASEITDLHPLSMTTAPIEKQCQELAQTMRENTTYVVNPGFSQGVSHANFSMELVLTLASVYERAGREIESLKEEILRRRRLANEMDQIRHDCSFDGTIHCPCCKSMLWKTMAMLAGGG